MVLNKKSLWKRRDKNSNEPELDVLSMTFNMPTRRDFDRSAKRPQSKDENTNETDTDESMYIESSSSSSLSSSSSSSSSSIQDSPTWSEKDDERPCLKYVEEEDKSPRRGNLASVRRSKRHKRSKAVSLPPITTAKFPSSKAPSTPSTTVATPGSSMVSSASLLGAPLYNGGGIVLPTYGPPPAESAYVQVPPGFAQAYQQAMPMFGGQGHFAAAAPPHPHPVFAPCPPSWTPPVGGSSSQNQIPTIQRELHRLQALLDGKIAALGLHPGSEDLQTQVRMLRSQINTIMDKQHARVGVGSNSPRNNKSTSIAEPLPTKEEMSSESREGTAQNRHQCSGCGSVRSRRYHLKHPLEQGKPIFPNLCESCRHREHRRSATRSGAQHICFSCGIYRSQNFHRKHHIIPGGGMLLNYCSRCQVEKRAAEEAAATEEVKAKETVVSSELQYEPEATELQRGGEEEARAPIRPNSLPKRHASTSLSHGPSHIDSPPKREASSSARGPSRYRAPFVEDGLSNSLSDKSDVKKRRLRSATATATANPSTTKPDDDDVLPSGAPSPSRSHGGISPCNLTDSFSSAGSKTVKFDDETTEYEDKTGRRSPPPTSFSRGAFSGFTPKDFHTDSKATGGDGLIDESFPSSRHSFHHHQQSPLRSAFSSFFRDAPSDFGARMSRATTSQLSAPPHNPESTRHHNRRQEGFDDGGGGAGPCYGQQQQQQQTRPASPISFSWTGGAFSSGGRTFSNGPGTESDGFYSGSSPEQNRNHDCARGRSRINSNRASKNPYYTPPQPTPYFFFNTTSASSAAATAAATAAESSGYYGEGRMKRKKKKKRKNDCYCDGDEMISQPEIEEAESAMSSPIILAKLIDYHVIPGLELPESDSSVGDSP
ncbi:hypothetical protein GMORB2_5771 [Geosmithia morbida]|uniref:Uncharacterized protein n=1 Tax=Geosmithia morbida TaxID=1094350 RepID=A0A9P5D5R3_9HYPO|nr:uncharacterized protein GMORB2_5771 [Geosmithia morbida]KAF4124055.1 hypothetical protein GMORB2_5771 [Geosmithia morbida]